MKKHKILYTLFIIFSFFILTNITKAKTNTFELINGEKEYNILSEEDYVLRFDANYKDFKSVQIDGKDLDKNTYTITEGSTIISISYETMKKIDIGVHTMTLLYANNKKSEVEFEVISEPIVLRDSNKKNSVDPLEETTVEESPGTGSGALTIIVSVAGLLLISYIIIRIKKRIRFE